MTTPDPVGDYDESQMSADDEALWLIAEARWWARWCLSNLDAEGIRNWATNGGRIPLPAWIEEQP